MSLRYSAPHRIVLQIARHRGLQAVSSSPFHSTTLHTTTPRLQRLPLATPPICSQQQQRPFSSSSSNDTTPDSAVHIRVDVGENSDLTIPGAATGGRKLAVVYTCKICDTRSVKQFTAQAYSKGVVIATCPGCQNRHLIADRLGYFDDKPVNLETIAKENGETLTSIGEGVTEINLEDLIGKDKMQELLEKASEK